MVNSFLLLMFHIIKRSVYAKIINSTMKNRQNKKTFIDIKKKVSEKHPTDNSFSGKAVGDIVIKHHSAPKKCSD